MLSALYAIVRPSVLLSVRLSITRVDHSKMVEVRIMQFSPFMIRYDTIEEINVDSKAEYTA